MGPHRQQPTRLRCPWDSPGKNTGVGGHFLLQCMKVKVKLLSRVRLLVTPWTAAYQAPTSMGFSRQEYWSGVPLPSSPSLLGPLYSSHMCLPIQPTLLNSLGLWNNALLVIQFPLNPWCGLHPCGTLISSLFPSQVHVYPRHLSSAYSYALLGRRLFLLLPVGLWTS